MAARRFRKQLRYREEDGKVCLEISLRTSRQLFDERDPAPFIERDLDDDAVDFIVSSAQEIPAKTPIKVQIFLTDEQPTPERAEEIRQAFHTYFRYTSDLMKKKLGVIFRGAQMALFVGLTVLVTGLTISGLIGHVDESILSWQRILKEGCAISGWVAMWRPINAVLYDWWPSVEKRRLHEKLASAQVEVKDRWQTVL